MSSEGIGYSNAMILRLLPSCGQLVEKVLWKEPGFVDKRGIIESHFRLRILFPRECDTRDGLGYLPWENKVGERK
jgi:hypothetical protein